GETRTRIGGHGDLGAERLDAYSEPDVRNQPCAPRSLFAPPSPWAASPRPCRCPPATESPSTSARTRAAPPPRRRRRTRAPPATPTRLRRPRRRIPALTRTAAPGPGAPEPMAAPA